VGDQFIRNIDLMKQATVRRAPNQPITARLPVTRFSKNIYQDLVLLGGVAPVRLRNDTIPRCASISIQMSNLVTFPPTGPLGIPVVTVRDSSLQAYNLVTNTFAGVELLPGDLVSFEADDHELDEETFLNPMEFYVVLNEAAAGATFLTLHIIYGVMQ
jgi:hypothetical protein